MFSLKSKLTLMVLKFSLSFGVGARFVVIELCAFSAFEASSKS